MPEITAFDVAVGLVVGLSILVAYLRGAVREVLSITTWVGAGVIALYGFPYARDVARRTIETDWMADAAALCVVFLAPLIGFKVVAAVVAEYLPGGVVQAVDRLAGAAFGAARGAIIVSAAYLAFTILAVPEDHPDWVKNAITLPYVKDGAIMLGRLMPEKLPGQDGEAAALLPGQGRVLRLPIDSDESSP